MHTASSEPVRDLLPNGHGFSLHNLVQSQRNQNFGLTGGVEITKSEISESKRLELTSLHWTSIYKDIQTSWRQNKISQRGSYGGEQGCLLALKLGN